jgi:hypothetical protein
MFVLHANAKSTYFNLQDLSNASTLARNRYFLAPMEVVATQASPTPKYGCMTTLIITRPATVLMDLKPHPHLGSRGRNLQSTGCGLGGKSRVG